MFNTLTEKFSKILRNFTGNSQLTASNLAPVLQEVRTALLEADVAVKIVEQFLNGLQQQCLGTAIPAEFTPAQFFIKTVKEALVALLGKDTVGLQLTSMPSVILMVGLQGSGKTTTTAKLALYLKEKQQKKVLLVSCDIYRPAAIEQLAYLGEQIAVTVFPSNTEQTALTIVEKALHEVKKGLYDVLIIDTAGRLHVDTVLMQELAAIHKLAKPNETLFVADSMTGQDAAHSALAFSQIVNITGAVLTKTDSDTRGGAALSIVETIKAPIKFLGTGEFSGKKKKNAGTDEELYALEQFHPERQASQILGMGDMLSLIEQIEDKLDKKKAEAMMQKLASGAAFTLQDFLEQLEQMQGLGNVDQLLAKLPTLGLPGAMANPAQLKAKLAEQHGDVKKHMAVIRAMTKQERCYPDLLKQASRQARIAKGTGVEKTAIRAVLQYYEKTQKQMSKFKKLPLGQLFNNNKGLDLQKLWQEFSS
jgi:signal recognition particle subunit SRP54